MGPQGSGKGTQAQKLSEELNIPALSMGQLLRDEVATGSDLGSEIKALIDVGSLVPDTMAADVLQKRLNQDDTKNGYILDGYPRNQAQLSVFDFDTPTHVIVIDVPRDESLKRLGGRLTCSTTGRIFAMSEGYKPGDECEDGGELIQRVDDTPDAINKRLDIYENETLPIISHFEEMGIVHKIDGVGSVADIYSRIMSELES